MRAEHCCTAWHPEPRFLPRAIRFEEVVRSTAEMVSKWQCVGFTHGVLNTDNMSLLGLTIDYGPYGFMDYFDPKYVPNGSDSGGRYSYESQPVVSERISCPSLASPMVRRCCSLLRGVVKGNIFRARIMLHAVFIKVQNNCTKV